MDKEEKWSLKKKWLRKFNKRSRMSFVLHLWYQSYTFIMEKKYKIRICLKWLYLKIVKIERLKRGSSYVFLKNFENMKRVFLIKNSVPISYTKNKKLFAVATFEDRRVW